ncbi:glycoside hydrolase family 18 [Catenulispora acidiphila DSM 44928]|uniref:Glycoside hydrolase family 18 n=1 Tax=Catenulispora acidiphila (strain DSM 44928 / JCM 14897 / NBRC 102108 / NRRL B-24433 / ID139908) TaxID=479433 RepID=C7PY64_CATAD|nr:glycosyl hydrolase family 18 protein [Catenulispora acidiphila]ACU75354.1 glycoside hydrolase family 18 [Catenulispora acidiphila DSM 44928]
MTSPPTLYRTGVSGVVALSLAAVTAVAGSMLFAHSATAAPTLAVTGYAEEGTANSAIDASAAAMATVGVDGININSAGTSAPAPDAGATSLLAKAHADNLRAEFLVGNYSSSIGDFDPAALDRLLSSPSNINSVVTTVVNAVNSQGWDGVTIDFESILGQDAQGLVDFSTALKQAMPAAKTVSIDVTAYQTAAEYTANGYNLSGLGGAVDRIALMAYDEHGPTWNGVGPIGGLPWQEACLRQLLTQVPAAKVDLGVAGYGYTWPKTGTGRQVSDAQARQMVAGDGSTATWDSTQGEWTATLKNGTVMWWSDAKSWPLRATLAQKYAVHGMALWSLGLSDPLPVTAPANGFSVAASPASGSVAAGASSTSTVSTAVTSGTAQSVALTAGGVPAGASVSFSPASVTAGSSSTMTVTTSSSTPVGTYPITVTGRAASGSHTATYTLTVTTASGSTVYEAEASSSVLAGGAKVVTCAACSGGARVGYLGGTGTLTMKNITVATAGSYQVTIAYTNGDTGNLRIMLSVNGGANATFTGAPTTNWDTPATGTITVSLAVGTNTILFSNTGTTGDVPDIDKIAVVSK